LGPSTLLPYPLDCDYVLIATRAGIYMYMYMQRVWAAEGQSALLHATSEPTEPEPLFIVAI